jgi:serine phosphatase RsbU (regulator of sigma subunit)
MGERQLLAGDTLLLYTDGATESLNDEREEFGEERLLEACGVIASSPQESCSQP